MHDNDLAVGDAAALGRLATLHMLGRRAREAATPAELDFILANESFQLAPYRQAALWWEGGVAALSGLSQTDPNTPFVQWLARLCPVLHDQAGGHPLLPRPADLLAELAAEWDDWLPAHALWLPMGPASGLLLARDDTWQDAEAALLGEWAATWHHARLALTRDTLGARLTRTLRQNAQAFAPARLPATLAALRTRQGRRYVLALTAVLLFPIRLSVLAPGELVPAHPSVVRAPMDGVVDQVLVTPNQKVKAGTALFSLDKAGLEARLAVANQTLATAQAEYRQQAQQALFDTKSKSRLATVQGSIGEKEAEVAYLRQQTERATLTAPADGIVLMDAPSEWIGRPVVTGERLATLATEGDEELEAWLALGDAIDLEPGAPVRLYLNTSPLDPVDARLRYVAHEAQQRPDGSFAYRLRADLADGSPRPRIGLKGTVKVSGGYTPLAWWLLRRPLAAARQFVGL